MINEEKILEAKDYPMDQLLTSLGVKSNGHNFQCPFHKSGMEKNYSAWVVPSTNRIYCLSCNVDTDTIEVYRHLTGADFQSAINYLTGSTDLAAPITPLKRNYQPQQETPLQERNINHVEDYRKAMTSYTRYELCNQKERHIIEEFLQSRNLHNALETLGINGYSIGIRTYKGYKNIAIDLKTFLQTRTSERKYDNGNLSLSKIGINSNATAVIVEGITDALAVAECGYNAISLNGVSNFNKLQLKPNCTYYVLLDNDTAGVETTLKIIEKWKDKVSIRDISDTLKKCKVKDVGELVSQGKGGELVCQLKK